MYHIYMMNYMTTSISSHIASAILNTDVHSSPYEWMHIENIFPDEYFKLLKSTPLEEVQHMLVNEFNDPNIMNAVCKKFLDAPKNGDTIQGIYAFWQTHGTGYTLKPHEDGPSRIFTFTIYLPDNNDYPEAGTAIYEVNEDTREYKTIDIVPYQMNSAMLIAPYNHRTWHGVDMLTKPIKRDSIVLVFANHEWKEGKVHYADWKAGVTVNHAI